MNVHGDAGLRLPWPATRIALGLVLVFGGTSIASAQQQQQEEQRIPADGFEHCRHGSE